MSYFFFFFFLAAVAGIIKPYLRQAKRWHFALGAIASFFAIGVFAEPRSPEQIAAQEKARAEAEAAEAREEAQAKADAVSAEQSKITDKVSGDLLKAAAYSRADYPKLYSQLGKAAFEKLDDLEPGALYAAAESNQCDMVESVGVSDSSLKGAVRWFVDCRNGNRFMVTQDQALGALVRRNSRRMALADLAESCTTSTVAMCSATSAQKNASEAEIVSACDILLNRAVVSPSTLDVASRWDYAISDKPDTLVVQRDFDSQNSFGAMIRSRYHCEVNAASGRITKFVVQGPMGAQKII